MITQRKKRKTADVSATDKSSSTTPSCSRPVPSILSDSLNDDKVDISKLSFEDRNIKTLNNSDPERFMKLIGNLSTWDHVKNSITSGNTVSVIYGPIGCGKTCGLRILAHMMKLQVIEIDGSCDFTDFTTQLKVAASRKSLGGRCVIYLEDINGWTCDNIKKLTEISSVRLRNSCSIVCTADDIFLPSLRQLRDHVKSYRLFPLNDTEIHNIVKFHNPSTTFHRCKKILEEYGRNDIRRLIMRCKGTSSEASDSSVVNIFKATEQILYKHAEAEKAFDTFSDHVVSSMIFRNYPLAVCDWIGPFSDFNTCDVLADVADVISYADCLRHGSCMDRTRESNLLMVMLPHRVTCKPSKIAFELVPNQLKVKKNEEFNILIDSKSS